MYILLKVRDKVKWVMYIVHRTQPVFGDLLERLIPESSLSCLRKIEIEEETKFSGKYL